MNEVAANAFRQGYTTRTYAPYKMFPYRDDNVQSRLKQFEFTTSASNVTFKLRFNINKIRFNSALNQEIQMRLKESTDDE